MRLLFFTALVISLTFISCTKEESKGNDEDNLIGTWQLIKIEREAGTTVIQEYDFEDSVYTLVFNQDSTISLSQFNGLDFHDLTSFQGRYTLLARERNPNDNSLSFELQTQAEMNSVNSYFPLGNMLILRKESLTLQNIALGQPSITINHTFRKE